MKIEEKFNTPNLCMGHKRQPWEKVLKAYIKMWDHINNLMMLQKNQEKQVQSKPKNSK